MSAQIIRDAFKTALQEFTTLVRPDVGYYETISENAEPQPPLWITASFFPTGSIPLLCGKEICEGTCEVDVFGEGGLSDDIVIALADQVVSFFNGNSILNNGVSLTRVEQPTESTNGDGVAWYGVTVALDYIVQL